MPIKLMSALFSMQGIVLQSNWLGIDANTNAHTFRTCRHQWIWHTTHIRAFDYYFESPLFIAKHKTISLFCARMNWGRKLVALVVRDIFHVFSVLRMLHHKYIDLKFEISNLINTFIRTHCFPFEHLLPSFHLTIFIFHFVSGSSVFRIRIQKKHVSTSQRIYAYILWVCVNFSSFIWNCIEHCMYTLYLYAWNRPS